MSHADPPGPLTGLRVVDCSTVLAGPYCTMLLADLGAEVVKVEPPDGDATRRWGPPWVGSEADGTRTAAYFLALNRNKRSLRLDLRDERGAAVLHRLLARSDVLVENFRPGRFARLGFAEADLMRLNPGLIHLAISGYGPTGPAAERPGYDAVVQATGGLMSITGFPDDEGGAPTKVGVAMSDVASGLFGTVAVLAGLLGRDREQGPVFGRGQRIDVSLLASTLAVLVNQAQNAFATGVAPTRRGNAHPNIVPYETFPTADGRIVVAVGSEPQWRRLCEALELPALREDQRFATNGDRVDHAATLRPILTEALARRSTAEWLDRLETAEVPSGRVNDILEAFATPEAEALGMIVELEHPVLGPTRQVGVPFRLAATPATVRTPPPLLGEHTDEILEELGYAPAEMNEFRAADVV
jgi:crotonobetainyl-CoA:carnitine CoA-transferase CaiB-like acyl-CoA transferase